MNVPERLNGIGSMQTGSNRAITGIKRSVIIQKAHVLSIEPYCPLNLKYLGYNFDRNSMRLT